ncbi:hypothetical protein [Paeniglutamicibacter sp. NPDC091659]|uniref:hypothetical protein n=1 Tax=Paeniglutamicibacter sp. NPDC091659 TaxID=3364389 RepID=UPI003811078A
MVEVQNKIQIRVPRADVAAYSGDAGDAGDAGIATRWQGNIDSATWLTGPP